jgi:hypothetical protein
MPQGVQVMQKGQKSLFTAGINTQLSIFTAQHNTKRQSANSETPRLQLMSEAVSLQFALHQTHAVRRQLRTLPER